MKNALTFRGDGNRCQSSGTALLLTLTAFPAFGLWSWDSGLWSRDSGFRPLNSGFSVPMLLKAKNKNPLFLPAAFGRLRPVAPKLQRRRIAYCQVAYGRATGADVRFLRYLLIKRMRSPQINVYHVYHVLRGSTWLRKLAEGDGAAAASHQSCR